LDKGRKAEIQALAAAQGKSLNQYVVDAIDEQEKRERAEKEGEK
jgi:predicted HicB family RNase H-like nuclease